MNCLLDWNKRKIVASGDQRKLDVVKLVKDEKKYQEALAWLRQINSILEKDDPLGNKIRLQYSRLRRAARYLRDKQQREKQNSPKVNLKKRSKKNLV
jgi:hypothetical protein